ncbi:glycosyltransferase family 2 protein [Thermococcus sibiricus]|uniref:Glycosyl transferase, family 2 n=1 Tax=Thermococcus sibiricus TaxID=172049 RepID=A0A101EL55_9EURY|nr:glycosyltransferase family 2 protein [Thermococcus sibiricus]KUK17263.1 MAG: Glycosyl transferase, family 2 [Thermococcus sibiricus]
MVEVSVIIPAYNAGRHISKTLQSLKAQTFEDIEVVVVNDGSTDNTVEVVEKALSDAPFPWKVVSQENMGASAARNRGLKMAKGKYVLFLDSDDYIHKMFIERMYHTAIKENYQAVFSNVVWVNSEDNRIIRNSNNRCHSSASSGRDVLKLMLQREFTIVVDNGIYEKSFLIKNSIKFNSKRKQFYGDVLEFVFRVLYKAQRVGCVPDVFVACSIRDNSVSSTLDKTHLILHFNNLVESYHEIQNHMINSDKEMSKLLTQYIGYRLLVILFKLYAIGETDASNKLKTKNIFLLKQAPTRNIRDFVIKFLVLYWPGLCRLALILHSKT